MPVVAFVGAKGGSLKSACSLSVAASVAAAGRHAVLVDCDPQGTATRALPAVTAGNAGVREESKQSTVPDPLSAAPVEVDIPEVLAAGGRLTLFRGGFTLVGAGRAEVTAHLARARGATAAGGITVVDTTPNLSEITFGVLQSADLIVIPTEPTADALDMLPNVVEAARRVAPNTPTRIVLTKTDRRQRSTRDALAMIPDDYPGLKYDADIPDSARGKEANGFLRPTVLYAPGDAVARAYRALTAEVLADLGLPPLDAGPTVVQRTRDAAGRTAAPVAAGAAVRRGNR